jgi:RNA polymerase sigma factor (sigma-70 family)
VVQETFCEAVCAKGRLADAKSIGGWLKLINHRNALNRLRDRRQAGQKAARSQTEAPQRAFTTGGFSALELRESVQRALTCLSPELHAVVTLRYFEHLSYREIAERLHVEWSSEEWSIGTIQYRLMQASDLLYPNLRMHLEAPGERPASGKPGSADSEAEVK